MNIQTYINQFENYNSISMKGNPFQTTLYEFTNKQLQSVLLQYTIFPKNIIAVLVSATYNLNFNGYDDLSSELIQNINEELGTYTNETILVIPKPHYTILRMGFSEGLGIEINGVTPFDTTNTFIKTLLDLVNQSNISEVLGTVFALESSAIPELEIVHNLVKRLFELNNKEIPTFLEDFFNFHIDDIEIGHRDRFFDLCTEHLITENQKTDFEIGFNNVLRAMEKWWFGMYGEIVLTNEKPAENIV